MCVILILRDYSMLMPAFFAMEYMMPSNVFRNERYNVSLANLERMVDKLTAEYQREKVTLQNLYSKRKKT